MVGRGLTVFFWSNRLAYSYILNGLFCASFVLSAVASARDLDLPGSVQLALKQNRGLQADAFQVQASAQGVAAASGRLLPRLDVSIGASYTDSPLNAFGTRLQQGRIGSNDFLLTSLNDPAGVSNYQSRLALTMPLYAGGQLRAETMMARQQKNTAGHGHRWLQQQVVFMTIRQYAAVLNAAAQVQAEEKALEAAEQHLENVRALRQRGMVIDSDVLDAEVHVLQRKVHVNQARNHRLQAEDALRRHLGLDDNEQIRLIEPVRLETAALRGQALADLVQQALHRREDILAMQARLAIARGGLRKSRAGFLPHVDFQAVQEWNDRVPELGQGNLTVGVQVGVNLFAGGSDRAAVDIARAEVAAMQTRLADLRQQASHEGRQAGRDLDEARLRRDVQQQALKQSSEALRIVELRHRQGLEKTADLLASQGRLDGARAAAIQASFDVDVSKAQLLLVSGLLSKENIQ